MCRKWFYLAFAVLVLIMAAGVPARADVAINVNNFSFELPGIIKQHCWDGERPEGGVSRDVPGWTDGTLTSNDSGVETGYTTAAHGTWTGFMMGGDPNVYNLTNFLIGSGDVFELLVNARNNWSATAFKISLFYDDNGKRVSVAYYSAPVTDGLLTSPSTLFSLTFSADTVPACLDHEIGIELDNVTTASASWVGFDNVQLTITSPLMRVQNPFPAHKGFYEGTSVNLTWVPGPNVPSVDNYKVYFSDNRADVNSGAAYKGSTSAPIFPISGLVQGLMYYWRIDTVSGANTYRGNIWNFDTKPLTSYNPNPSTGIRYVPVDSVLSWEAGTGAVKGHVVFFGDNFNDVNNAPKGTSGSPPFRAYLTNLADVNWVPSEAGLTLETDKTYYWRIDEVQSTSPQTIHKGNVWSFTTVPIVGLGSITREVWENITGTTIADLTGNANYPDNPSFSDHLPLFDTPRDWADDYGTRVHGWLYVETTGDYTFWFSSDEAGELWLDSVLIASNTAAIGFHQWDNSPQSDPIHLEAGNLYYIMALQKEGTGRDTLAVAWSTSTDDTSAAIIPGTNLLPFEMYSRVWAFEPNPVNGAIDSRIDPNLSWRPGEYTAKHDVYFGTDFNDVNDAGISTAGIYKGPQSDTTYTPGTLEFNTTYYWRIDEVNDAHPDKLWKGTVWSFTTGNFLVVDDFEGYNDVDNIIYNTWSDYYTNNTGMTVGHLEFPFAERRTGFVHSGSQSMYMRYDNDGTVNEGTAYEKAGTKLYSETEREWTNAQDWTAEGVNALILWFRGIPASFGSFTPGPPIYTMTARGTDIWGTADQFHFAYKMLSGSGSITAKVVSLTNTHNRAKAGVMIRETLAEDSAHTMVCFNPEGRIEFIRRPSMGAASVDAATAQTGISVPVWVRLTRSGNIFTAESSANGATWTTLGSVEMPMLVDVYVGLCLTSHDVNLTCTAEFSNVANPGTGDWKSQDIGIQSNIAEQMYVVLQDSAGNSSPMVKNADPAATTIAVWTPWNIPLTDFVGVDLKAIKKMIIGVGDRANTQPVGEGDLYIDDVRLNLPAPAQ